MKIWVDADACPAVIKEFLYRVAERKGLEMVLVANKPLRIPARPGISFIHVEMGSDVADNEIVRQLEAGDLVITADIPLAASVLAKGGHALNPRGELYSSATIGAKLSVREFMDTLRGSGVITGGPPPLASQDKQAFADQLEKLLTKLLKKPHPKPAPPIQS